jgi:hypothetical protein
MSGSSCITWTIPWGTPVSNCQTTSRRPNRLSLWIKVWHTETISAPSVVSPCTKVIWETDWKRTSKPCLVPLMGAVHRR